MLTSPQPLDWSLQAYIGPSIVWHPGVYGNFEGRPESTTRPQGQELRWIVLPFEDAQIDKIPQRGGIYMMFHQHKYLASAQQDIVLYIGEATDLRDRLNEHLKMARKSAEDSQPHDDPKTHNDRLKLLFKLFPSLTIHFCILEFSQEERKQLERQLIGLFDPPFNLHHRPAPRGRPMVSRPGALSVVTGREQPAFSN